MTSITLPSHINSNNIDDEKPQHVTNDNCPTNNRQHSFQWSTSNRTRKASRASSYTEEKIQSSASSSSSGNNRLKHLCTRLKRRFSITKDYRTRSEDMNRGLAACFSNYETFSSSIDDTSNEFEWPDFEKIYDSIPPCLAKILPGLDDISIEDDDDNNNNTINTKNFITDETNEQSVLFEHCKRGKHFRRNAICHKLDKTQYHGQLDIFIQQLMIEKLIRTWT